MAKDYQGIEKLKPCRHHHEHIDGGGVLHVIVQKRAAGRGRDFAPPWQISADRGLAHFDADLSNSPWIRARPKEGLPGSSSGSARGSRGSSSAVPGGVIGAASKGGNFCDATGRRLPV
jgi:hypothetical protein